MHGPAHRHAFVKPPSAARRPNIATWHGVELVDDYAWLRAANWQDVMRDPAVLDPEIRAYLEAENAYTRGAARRHARACRTTLFAEMKARIKEDDSSVPRPTAPSTTSSSYRHRRAVSAGLRRRPRGGGAEAGPARRQRGGRGQALLAARRRGRTAPTTGCWPMPSTTRARSSSPSASATWRPARTCPTPSPTRAAPSCGRATAARCSTSASTTTTARCSSTATAVGTPGRGRRAGLRGKGHRLLRRRRPDAVGASSSSSTPTTTRPTRST